jgi:hypothetical protein
MTHDLLVARAATRPFDPHNAISNKEQNNVYDIKHGSDSG